MGYKLELNPEAFARTQQGGCVMTAKDTDTNIIEPLILKEGRAGVRTAINRDGLLYDVLPYEPAMSLKNGVMGLSEEPLGENYVKWSNDLDSWTKGSTGTGSNPAITQGYSDSIRLGYTADRVQMSLNGGTTMSDSSKITADSGGTFLTSCSNSMYVKSTDGSEQTFFVRSGSDIGTRTVSGSDWIFIDFKSTSSSNYFEFGIRGSSFGGSLNSDSIDLIVCEAQREEGVVATSRILTNGATGVRLGATGVNTPDISKWVDSKAFSFEVVISALANDGTNREISLSDGTNNNTIAIRYTSVSNQIQVVWNRIGYSDISMQYVLTNATEFNKVRATVTGNQLYFDVNESEYTDNREIVPFDDNQITVLKTRRGGAGRDYYGEIKNITIKS